MSALLTSETGNTAKVVKYINECREMHIRVLAPDVNSSDLDFTPVVSGPDEGIRFGLGAIKNVGANAVESIAKARTDAGPFTSLYDFCERVDLGAVNRRMIESFIKAGAMDTLEGTRAQLMAVIDSAMENGTRVWMDRASGQSGLFAMLTATARRRAPAPKSPRLDRP
jgi:DNA polymerase-3 subunit alpha